jgi:hypothetical protein
MSLSKKHERQFIVITNRHGTDSQYKKSMKNFHVIEVKYHGATNTRGSKVSLYSARFKKRISIPFDYSLNHPSEMAEKYLLENGFEIVGCGDGKQVDFIITDTFKTI